MVLNLHGEVADLTGHGDISHEEAFLPCLKELNKRFPKLRLVNTLFTFVNLLGVFIFPFGTESAGIRKLELICEVITSSNVSQLQRIRGTAS